MNIVPPNVAPADILENEKDSDLEVKTFGFWIYLMSDLVLFSVLFATFAVIGHNYAGVEGPKELFHLPYLFGETILLLLSSFTFGLGMLAMWNNNKKAVLIFLAITFFLGAGFVTMEINEFINLILSGYGPDRSGFLSSFFTLVGTHGVHVSFGLIWILVMIIQISNKGFTNHVRYRLINLSLLWHFLDIVWVGVFTIVYLLGVL